jgi:hypothetical protein
MTLQVFQQFGLTYDFSVDWVTIAVFRLVLLEYQEVEQYEISPNERIAGQDLRKTKYVVDFCYVK